MSKRARTRPSARPRRVARRGRAAAVPRRRPAVRDVLAGHDPGVLAELFLAPHRPAVAAPSRARPGDDAVARACWWRRRR